MLTAHQVEKYQRKLHTLRAELDSRVASLHDEALRGAAGEPAGDLSHAPIHLGDIGGQEGEAVVNLALAAHEASLRQEVEDALARFDAGTFGVCEDCRDPIGAERLDAIPYARLCIRCAERA